MSILNSKVREQPVDIKELIELISNYLEETNPDKASEVLNLIIQNNGLIYNTLPEVFEYYRRKYNIKSVIDRNNKIVLYYEWKNWISDWNFKRGTQSY